MKFNKAVVLLILYIVHKHGEDNHTSCSHANEISSEITFLTSSKVNISYSIQSWLKLKLGSLGHSVFAAFSPQQKDLVFTVISRENMKNATFHILNHLCKHVNILNHLNMKMKIFLIT